MSRIRVGKINTGSSCKNRIISIFLAVVLLSVTGAILPVSNGSRVFGAVLTGNYQLDSRIRLNSIGYLPSHDKKATIVASCTSFHVVKEDGTIVYTGTPTSMMNSDTSEQVYIANFSTVTEAGTYYLAVPNVGKSVNFKISNDVYNDAYKVSMLGMYLWRCGTAVSATYNGNTFAHAACHTKDAYMDYITGQHTIRDGTKGWHDAGDYNKYVVNAGITVGSMFMAWEHFKDKIEKIPLTMPESSNSIPDFLDEMKFEIDWLLTMQYPDGSGKVSHKLSTKSFGGFIMPENETTERYFTPFGTAATADFVAMTAMAARIFKPYDAAYAEKCLNAAKVSYAYLKANPNNQSPNQSGFSTGGYDTSDGDDRLWAAAEMWETTGDSTYLSDFETMASRFSPKIDTDFDWGNVKNLGMFTYILSSKAGRNQSMVDSIKRDLISAADSIVTTANSHGYGRTLGTRYYWGCNGTVARQTMVLQIANRLSPKSAYLNAALSAIDHLFGRNYYNRSFVTGLGINPPMFPHDRRAGGDSIADPWPGYLVGGGWPGAKDWVDVEASYQTNEIAINWNGALIYALAGFVDTSSTTPTVIYGDVDGNGTVDSTDYTLMKRYVLRIITALPGQNGEKAADVNADGVINSTDLTLMKRYLLKIITKFPADQ
ncbi:MAG: glycoside hydrolase family 9 protein [Bacillota bacterium]